MAIGKITPINIEPAKNGVKTMTNSLAGVNRTRFPGCASYIFPKKLPSGVYKTGLDENAPEVLMIEDPKERKAEQKRIVDKRKRLEDLTGFDLSPRSPYWNYTLYTDQDPAHVQAVRLQDGPNLFDLSRTADEIAFAWLKETDLIAKSYESYLRGDKGSQVRFYVHDEEVESKRVFDRKQQINKAVAANDTLSPDKRKKIAMLMGLGVSPNASEQAVYVIVDDAIKETELKSGKHKGLNPIRLFMQLVNTESQLLDVKFLVEEAIKYNVYRKRAGGALYEGEIKVADSEEALVTKLCNPDFQEDLIAFEKVVRSKKLSASI